MCAEDKPDLILMDISMPDMDGVSATSTIMKENPCAILIVTSTISDNSSKVFEAMGNGALDAVSIPVLMNNGEMKGERELLKKISTLRKLIDSHSKGKQYKSVAKSSGAKPTPLIAIGCSTGGPKALSVILSQLPKKLGASIAVIQHVDVQFASSMAEWLNEQTVLPVALAGEGMRIEKDTIYLAETNDHIIIGEDLAFHYTKEPRKYPYRPSIDTFFLSLENNWPRKDVAVLLTGIGKDGARGLFSLRNAGWHTIAQDEKTSVIYGMPKAAAELGAAREILSLEDIEASIVYHIQNEG